ncbi:MAG: pyridoxamine 5-phosphate oxidase-related FMN-binding protein [Blastococcus sp.]|nr:pyridoxamine 5-phosphate oxidase-related FMN-binding protein [Blastococcus sp.]
MRRTETGWEVARIDPSPSWTAEALDDPECRRLMRTVEFGRLSFTRGALPVVQPVRFGIRHGEVVIPTRTGSKLARAVRGAVVAFEVDCLDELTGAGWTVSAVGPAHVLTDTDDVAAAAHLGLRTWIPLDHYSYVAVHIVLLRGYRVFPAPNGRTLSR